MSDLFLSKHEFEEIFKSKLKIGTYSKSIDSLFSDRFIKKIDYAPYYQRNYVWDKHKASYFIESILLGTEIPPLVFFNNGDTIEVIDGRQRFETIKRFKNNDFSLTKKGLCSLKFLSKKSYAAICNTYPEIHELFLDAKIRMIDFEIIDCNNFDPNFEDRIKKEIFGRYNSGITPLRKSEIDNAVYVENIITNQFKRTFKEHPQYLNDCYSIFFKVKEKNIDAPPTQEILQFIRKSLVTCRFPIIYYARGINRNELVTKFFQLLSDTCDNPIDIVTGFLRKVQIIKNVIEELEVQSIPYNRFVFECFLWGLNVVENEELTIDIVEDKQNINKFADFVNNNYENYSDVDYHYFKETMLRYTKTSEFFTKLYDIDFSIYLEGNEIKKEEIRDIKSNQESPISKLNELESLRITKPEPTRNSIDDLLRRMERNKFLIRPSYQRAEVINSPKASSIIESILLGIMLPAIFIYKKKNGVSEVIDGQQRLLTLIGFIGKEYLNEESQLCCSKNHRFKLKGLKILKELNGKNFDELEEKLQNRIYDFDLLIVEIEEKLNENFNPVDLFIRLNDKPFPIPENSFEMWNSWADREIISTIKENVVEISNWFYVKSPLQRKYMDRMINEELYTSLVYLDYRVRYSSNKTSSNLISQYLDIYQKFDRINSRIKEKRDITIVMTNISEKGDNKDKFFISLNKIEKFIQKIEYLLIGDQKHNDALLNDSLDQIFSSRVGAKYTRRTFQDFYILWFLINEIDMSKIKKKRNNILKAVNNIYSYIKNIPEIDLKENKGFLAFQEMVINFKHKYQ